jgi:hypothetical protein
MRVTLDYNKFNAMMNNVIGYSTGFLDGINQGKTIFLKNLADGTIETLRRYIDANARMNPDALHHVYEWYRVGNADARLFNINSVVRGTGISINSTFRQSSSISRDSKEPFYNKARIMEKGIPITIKPKESSVLVFEESGETVFTKNEIVINNPGGNKVRGSFEKVIDQFFTIYFSQAFLKSCGIMDYLENPRAYKDNFAVGAKTGSSAGKSTGYKWIINAKVEVE